MSVDDSAALIDRVLGVCGGGRVVVAGARATVIVKHLRRRAVSAEVFVLDALPVGAVDLVWIDGELDLLAAGARRVWVARLRQMAPRVLLAHVAEGREAWVGLFLQHDWRRHPLYQCLEDYASLENRESGFVLVEPMPAQAALARALPELAATRDLHMDMLREVGRRADAHVARYAWARRFVRPGDRVLDAACGLGYGSALLADATLADTVTGIDADGWATSYASEHYGASRSRLSFDTRDVAVLAELPAASFDLIVSFETIEHVPDPEQFVATCRRLLTPGGRFICSIPNEWVDETGRDPNPYHLHVFDRSRLEALCGREFSIEHVYGQTAGGGMKLGDRPRAIWEAVAGEAHEAEWWLLVGMSDPMARCADPSTSRWTSAAVDVDSNLLAFHRDYDHPWIVRAMVALGQRTTSPGLLLSLARTVRSTAAPDSADAGAALCVQAYRALECDAASEALMTSIDDYCRQSPPNAHARRWQISLSYARALLHLAANESEQAMLAFEQCATADPLAFHALLATKTVAASSSLGWMAAQAGDSDRARHWWRHGVSVAERALHRPWSELMVHCDEPVVFGLREAADIVGLASQCATGLHLLARAAGRPGILAQQLGESYPLCAASPTPAPPREQPVPLPMAAPSACLDHVQRVVVFGTGMGGRMALKLAAALHWQVLHLLDNNAELWGQQALGHEVRSPDGLHLGPRDLVIVASVEGKDAMFDQLWTMGLAHHRHFIHFLEPVAVAGLRVQATLP